MPHSITHMYVVANSFDKFNTAGLGSDKYAAAITKFFDSNKKLHKYAQKGETSKYRSDKKCTMAGLVYLGSFGPDFFYIPRPVKNEAVKKQNSTIADIGHYNKTGSLVVWALMNLKKRMENQDPIIQENLYELAYWMGYMSHIAVDSVLHPFINSIVGAYPILRELFSMPGVTSDYLANEVGQSLKFHYVLETYLDAFLLYHKMSKKVLYSEYGPSKYKFDGDQSVNMANAGATILLRNSNSSPNPSRFSVTRRFIDFYNFQKATNFSKNSDGTFTYPYSRGLKQEKEVNNYFNDVSGPGNEKYVQFENFIIDSLPERGQLKKDHIKRLVHPETFFNYCEKAKKMTLDMWKETIAYLQNPIFCRTTNKPIEIAEDLYKAKEFFPILGQHWNLDTGFKAEVTPKTDKKKDLFTEKFHPKFETGTTPKKESELYRKLLIVFGLRYVSCIDKKMKDYS
ncbi:MAG: zinc dependent phospholipase C family protein [bacterium]|nr:zinc dependent phospholipase C family protein [bacterium]